MKPNILALKLDANQLIVDFYLPEDLFWFKGHFPVQPILPGVAQLDWALTFAQEHLHASLTLKNIKALKFQMPLLPKDQARLTLTLNQAASLLDFSYQREQDSIWHPISSGKISVCL